MCLVYLCQHHAGSCQQGLDRLECPNLGDVVSRRVGRSLVVVVSILEGRPGLQNRAKASKHQLRLIAVFASGCPGIHDHHADVASSDQP